MKIPKHLTKMLNKYKIINTNLGPIATSDLIPMIKQAYRQRKEFDDKGQLEEWFKNAFQEVKQDEEENN